MKEIADKAQSIREKAIEDLLAAVPDAVRTLIELAQMGDSEVVRRQAALDVLGISGISSTQKQEVEHSIKRGRDEVDGELERVLEKLEARQQKQLSPPIEALPAGEAPIEAASTEALIEAPVHAHMYITHDDRSLE